ENYHTLHKRPYQIDVTLPGNGHTGGYGVHAWTSGPAVGQGLGQFTVALGGTSGDAAALTAINTQLTGISSSLNVLTTGFNGINTGSQSLAAATAQLNTLSSGGQALTT